MDTVYNLTKLFKEATQGQDQPDAPIRDDDIVLTQVKLKVKTCKWTGTPQTNIPTPARTVNITKNESAGPNAVGQVQTTNENQNFVRVNLNKGIVRGLNRPLKLPLDESRPDLIAAFGRYVEIDPSKVTSEPIQNKMKIGVAVEGALGSQGATATLRNKENQYRGHFRCKVIMKGPGLACGRQHEIAGAIQYLKTIRGRDNSDIAGLKVVQVKRKTGDKPDKTVLEFTMEGELECKWDYEHTVEWK